MCFKLRNPLTYPIPYSRTKKYHSPSSTMPLPTSRTVCDLYFIVHFIFHIANYLLCILYRVVLLYPRPTAHFLHVYLSYFTNPASWLPHWNRLSCLVLSCQPICLVEFTRNRRKNQVSICMDNTPYCSDAVVRSDKLYHKKTSAC